VVFRNLLEKIQSAGLPLASRMQLRGDLAGSEAQGVFSRTRPLSFLSLRRTMGT
jgi:hypothetical protein